MSPDGGLQQPQNMSATCIIYHIVFRTQNSRPVIDVANEEHLYRYVWRFVEDYKGRLYAIGGMPDHIHILTELPPSIALSNFMRDLKVSTSKFLSYNKDKFPYFEGWGKEYFAETHSMSQKEILRNYIKGQKQHHMKMSFRDELQQMYINCGIPINPYFLKD